MLGDAHSTNWAENYQFFVNQNNPTNFERVWNQAYYLYRRMRLDHASAGAVRPGDGLHGDPEAGRRKKYSSQKDEYVVKFCPRRLRSCEPSRRS